MTISSPATREWRQHWPLVLASSVGVSLPTLYVYSMGAMMQPIQHDLGWSRAQIAAGLAATTTVAAIISPAAGAAVDRFGSRALAIPGVIIYCGAFALASQATTPLSWLLLWAFIGLCSAGVKPTVWATSVSGAFRASRGFALAVMLCGSGLGAALVPVATSAFIDRFGWRLAYVALALAWAIVVFPLVLVFFRNPGDAARSAGKPAATASGMHWREAMPTWRYICLMLVGFLSTLVTLGFVVSIIPMLTGDGIGRTAAASIAGGVGLLSIIGRLASGYLFDRLDARYVGAASVALPAITGGLLLGFPGSIAASTVAVLLIGVSQGAELGAISYLVARYFGLRSFGLLFGVAISATTLATGLGPLVASAIYDATGSYRLVMLLAVPFSLGAAAMLLTLGRPPGLLVVDQAAAEELEMQA